jgi:hypothetical protein
MEVYLLRHGLAEERSESGDDVHRVLTAAGIRQISHTALVMQTLQIQLGAIVTIARARRPISSRTPTVFPQWLTNVSAQALIYSCCIRFSSRVANHGYWW